MTHNPSSHRYRRNLVIAFTGTLLAGSLIVAVFVLVLVMRLAASTLDPQHTPIDQTPDVIVYTPVSFTTEDNVTLSGWYIPSTNGGAIILVHGYGGNRTDLLSEAEILGRAGYGVLLFDLRGHGESQSARITLGHHEQRDLAAALDFVAAQPGVDPDRIGGLGFSMGGAALTLTAATDERLRAVVIEAAFASLEDVIDDKAGLLGPLTQIPARWAIKHEGVDIDSVRPVDALCNISPRPVFLIYGGADDTVPPGSQQRMFDAVCEPADTWLIPAAAHQNYTEVVPDEYAARLLDFFERSLSPLPTALPFFIIAGSNALKVRQIMPIELVSGDLFVNRFKAQAFVHGCNCQGSMGAGIAKRFKELYPAMFEEYRRRCKTEPREFNLGDSFLWQDDSGPWVFNLGTQEQYWHGRATYKAIETALNRMKQQAVDHHIESIAIPRIGTGYGGLSWNKVRGIIETVFEDWSGTLYIYEEYVADQ